MGAPPKSVDPVTRLFFFLQVSVLKAFVNFGGLTTFVLPEEFSASCFVSSDRPFLGLISWTSSSESLKASEVWDPRRWPSQVAKVARSVWTMFRGHPSGLQSFIKYQFMLTVGSLFGRRTYTQFVWMGTKTCCVLEAPWEVQGERKSVGK